MHAGARTKTISISAAIAMLVLAGCGSSGSGATSSTTQASATATSTSESTSESTSSTTTTTSSATSSEKVPTIDLPLASSTNLNPIAVRYTCDGANVSPPISWSQIPPHTAELDLFVFNFLPVGGKLFADWAVAGLSPSLHGLTPGQTLPAGAIVGRNSFGQTRYSLCPPKGINTRFAFLLYALPKRIPAKPGFNAEALREQALHSSEQAGLLAFSYKRP
jgi:phosphatidylethanolamine-binding protein (PEBP) family uncharacterized protein